MNFYISLQFTNSLKDMLVKTRESILSAVNNSFFEKVFVQLGQLS